MGVAYHLRRRRADRQDAKAFAVLIETPAVGNFAMPASGRVRFVAVAGSAEGSTAATLTGSYYTYSDVGGVIVRSASSAPRTIKTPLLTAGEAVVIDRIERAIDVDPEVGFDVQVDVGLGVWKKIAEGA